MSCRKTGIVATGLLLAVWAFARDEDYAETAAFSKLVEVSFSGSSATVNNQAGPGVTCIQNGADLVFSNTVKQVAFALKGVTSAGSVKIYSGHAFKLILQGARLTNPSGPAVNIQSKKRCYVVLAAATASALADGASYLSYDDATNGVEDAKGVLFSEGPILISGSGALSVAGFCAEKHGICSDDFVRMFDGDITVSMAKKKSDGVHVNDRFQMDGGKLAIALALKGDGIDADDSGSIAINGGEVSIFLSAAESKGIKCGTNTFCVAGGAISITSEASACNALSGGGAMTLEGGVIDIALSGTDCNAIKSDRSVVVNGGAVSIATSGAQSKGVKTDGDAVFNGGTLHFKLEGDTVLMPETNGFFYADPSYCVGIKASNITVHAGSFSMVLTGLAGRGFSAENDLSILGGTVAVAACGAPSATYTNREQELDLAATTCLKADGKLAVMGGTLTLSVAGDSGKGLSAGSSMLFTGGSINLDVTGSTTLLDLGSPYKEPAFCSAITCDGNVTVSNGTFEIQHAGVAGRGISADGDMILAGGVFAVTVTGANTSVFTNGGNVADGSGVSSVDVGSASAIKVDGNLTIVGGTFNLLATGDCGKCINVGGVLNVGTNGLSAAPVITAKTTGRQMHLPGGIKLVGDQPEGNEEYSNPKAIKVTGNVLIGGGSIAVATEYSGGEGIESKDTITVNGGLIEATCYDDCLNAASNITINGGVVFCSSSNNDGIDSNGTLLMNGGTVVSLGTDFPEAGLDCNQNFFTVNGGTFVGCGGATSYPNMGSQYSLVYTGMLNTNSILRITGGNSASVFAFKMPRTYPNTIKMLCGCSGIRSRGVYTVYVGATMTGAEFHGLYTNNVSSASGGLTRGSDSTPAGRYYAVP